MATLYIRNVPDALYRKLRARATSQRRSITREVVHILTDVLEEPEPTSLLRLRGLGKDLFKGLDAARHVDSERDSWD